MGETGEWTCATQYEDFELFRGAYTKDIDNDQKLEIITSIKVDSAGNIRCVRAGGGLFVLEDDSDPPSFIVP